MTVLLYGDHAQILKDLVLSYSLNVVTENPDVVISYGGDGTLLAAEREYPGIPKLPMRNSLVCKKCPPHTNEVLLKALADQKIEQKSYQKMSASFQDVTLEGLNEVVITNPLPIHAVRFSVSKNDQSITDLVIGDGIVAATPFGASGYFHSITRQKFTQGFGLGFNNPVSSTASIFFDETDTITVTIIRAPATVTADNNPYVSPLEDGAIVTITKAQQAAIIYAADTLRCPACKVL